MKIRKIDCFVVDGHRTNWIVVRVTGEDGTIGLGESSLEYHEELIVAAVSRMADDLIGRDAFEIHAHSERLIRDAYWRGGPVLRTALSGIDGALHDLKARALGVPVYDLLGGKQRESIPVYANTWMPSDPTPEAIADAARRVVDDGFKGLKFDPFYPSYLQRDRKSQRESYRTIAAVRKAVGDDIAILIEAHGRFDVQTAVTIARDISDLGITWFEEPVPPDNIDALADVRRQVEVPIAAGERFYDPYRVAEALKRDAVDVLQPDICHVGGLTGIIKIASIALAHYRPIAPHNVNGPIANAMTLHAVAAIPNASILETCFVDAPWRGAVFDEEICIVDGEMVIPDTLGLGINFNPEVAAEHPARPHRLPHYCALSKRNRSSSAVAWYRNQGGSQM